MHRDFGLSHKKVKGVKRNIITDKDGDILEVSTTSANIHDSKSAYAIVAMLVVALPWIRRIYADRGYRGNFIEEARHDFGIDVEITHSNYSGKFVTAKKRWVVERTFAWLENFRRLCRNYEVTTESANEMLMVAAVVITPPANSPLLTIIFKQSLNIILEMTNRFL